MLYNQDNLYVVKIAKINIDHNNLSYLKTKVPIKYELQEHLYIAQILKKGREYVYRLISNNKIYKANPDFKKVGSTFIYSTKPLKSVFADNVKLVENLNRALLFEVEEKINQKQTSMKM